MKNIVLFKNKGMKDIFDDDDNVKNVMTPSGFSGKKYGLPEKAAFLYKGFPMYLDRTVIHVRKEDIPKAQEFMRESVELNESNGYIRNPDYDVKKGETLGGTSQHKNQFKSKHNIHAWSDKKHGMNFYTKHGDDANKTGTKIYGSAESAHNDLNESVEQIDEISSKKMEDYITKAKDDGMKEFKKGNSDKFKKRLDGIRLAAKKSTLKRYDNAFKGVKESNERIDEVSVKTLQSYRDKGQGTEEDIKKRHKSLDLALNKIRKANLKDKFTKSYDKKDEPKVAASKPTKTPKTKQKPLRIWDSTDYNKNPTLLERINKIIKQ